MTERNNARATDVAVVGAGLVGLAAALGFARCGQQVTLVRREPAPAPRGANAPWDLRVYAVSPASRVLLESLGAWSRLDPARIAPVYDMRVHSSSELHFGAYEVGIEALAWIVEQDELAQALEALVRDAGIAEQVSPAATGLDLDSDPDFAGLHLDSGVRVRARLIVAADGADSPLRALAGIGFREELYPQRALVAHFETELAHRDCAFQWFGAHGILALLPLPPAPVSEAASPVSEAASPVSEAAAPASEAASPASEAASPGRQGRCSMVWSAPVALADELAQCAPEQLAPRLEAACGRTLGAMFPISPVASFALRRRTATTLLAPRLALVGDAAHVVHPLAGQGLNLGLGDVADLLAAVGRVGDAACLDPGSWLRLRRYARVRAAPLAAMGFAMDSLQRLFDPASTASMGVLGAPIVALREWGWRRLERVPALKRWLIARAVN